MKHSFHVTLPLSAEEREVAEAKAQSQEARVKAFFSSRIGAYSPVEVKEHVLPEAPLTSVRRAITNLTNQKYLEKSGVLVEGLYGMKNNTWRARCE